MAEVRKTHMSHPRLQSQGHQSQPAAAFSHINDDTASLPSEKDDAGQLLDTSENESRTQSVFLRNKKEFQDVLEHYTLSEHAQAILDNLNYVVLVGPAAGGRNTIIRYLVESIGGYKQVVSDTTRPPKIRDGKLEQDGINYFFRSEEDLLEDLRAGEFLEAELIHDQQVSGTSIRELEKAKDSGLIAINEVEFGGAMSVRAAKPDAKIIAILPPSFDIWRERFGRREEITETEFRNRVKTAEKVIQLVRSDQAIRVVINAEYEQAAEAVDRFVKGLPQTEEERHEVGIVLDDFERHIQDLASKV